MTLEEAGWYAINSIPHISMFAIILFAGFFYIAPILFFVSIWKLRKTHAGHIYVIWLFFSFFFMAFAFLSIAAAQNNVQVEDVFGENAKKFIVVLLGFLRDGQGEIKFVLVMVGLVVLPQWLTYLLSGLTGSASPPVFVSQVTDIAIWSLVKFSAALAGIVAAEPVVKLAMGVSFTGYSWSAIEALGLLGIAFFLVWMKSIARSGIELLYQRRAFRALRPLHTFFTRFSVEDSRD
jgi:hypothetical protein